MKARDVAFLMFFAALGLALGLLSPLGCPQGFDCEAYFAMAADPSRLSGYLPPHAQRILPSLVVHLMTKVGIAVPAGFSILAVLAFIAIPTFCYLALRRCGGALESFAMTAWLWITPWQFTLALFDVGQAGYLWAFVAMIGIAMAYEDGRPEVIALIGLLGAFCRQEVLIIATSALLALAYRRRTWRPLFLGGLVGSIVLVAMAGIGGGLARIPHDARSCCLFGRSLGHACEPPPPAVAVDVFALRSRGARVGEAQRPRARVDRGGSWAHRSAGRDHACRWARQLRADRVPCDLATLVARGEAAGDM